MGVGARAWSSGSFWWRCFSAFARIIWCVGAAGRYRPEAKFTTWLCQIVLNLCRDRLRRSRRAPINLGERSLPAYRDEPPRRMEAEELADRIRLGRIRA